MIAKIYKPAKSAMQSGQAKTHHWILSFVPSSARFTDPLMGWTGSTDMDAQVQLTFETREAAEDYARHHGIEYRVDQPKKRSHILRKNGYGDNFSHNRRAAWTH